MRILFEGRRQGRLIEKVLLTERAETLVCMGYAELSKTNGVLKAICGTKNLDMLRAISGGEISNISIGSKRHYNGSRSKNIDFGDPGIIGHHPYVSRTENTSVVFPMYNAHHSKLTGDTLANQMDIILNDPRYSAIFNDAKAQTVIPGVGLKYPDSKQEFDSMTRGLRLALNDEFISTFDNLLFSKGLAEEFISGMVDLSLTNTEDAVYQDEDTLKRIDNLIFKNMKVSFEDDDVLVGIDSKSYDVLYDYKFGFYAATTAYTEKFEYVSDSDGMHWFTNPNISREIFERGLNEEEALTFILRILNVE